MTRAARAQVASSFTILKGALIEESYSYLASWDPERPRVDNLREWKERNPTGMSTQTWSRDVAFVMSRRFDPSGRDASLATLARGGCDLVEWKPILLWHITRDEFVLRDFLQNWLFPAFEQGVFRMRAEDVYAHLESLESRGATLGRPWSRTTIDRVAHALLVMAKDFGLLTGGASKEFAPFQLPERSFLYLLHELRGSTSPGQLVSSPEWRMFLMRPENVEHELLRLHQFRKLGYQVAGSLVEISLPCSTSREYAMRMLA